MYSSSGECSAKKVTLTIKRDIDQTIWTVVLYSYNNIIDHKPWINGLEINLISENVLIHLCTPVPDASDLTYNVLTAPLLPLQTCYGTNGPVWEDAFTFFIQDPRKQDIDIQVNHPSWTDISQITPQ